MLWERYINEAKNLENKNGKESPDMQLWHGARGVSSETITNGKEGFDMRFGNLHGLYGGGLYFAPNASYSTGGYQYNEPNGDMGIFYTNVLIGEATTKGVDPNGKNKAPLKDGSTTERYDCCTDHRNMYVVYSNLQAYPSYYVQYK